ncbi:MAG: hypothetical protein ACFFCW_38680 [Candidatus Hodarchaeota archaeon]
MKSPIILVSTLIFFSFLEAAFPKHGSGSSTFPYVLDTNVYTIPTNLGKPAKGKTIVDPNFYTKITRITDADKDLGQADKHMRINYPKFDIASCDGSLILLRGNSGSGWHLYDGRGFAYIKALNTRYVGWGSDLDQRWDHSDPNVFYYRRRAGFYKYDLTTDKGTLLHDLSINYPGATYAGNGEEGDSSRDSRYWAFMIKHRYETIAFVVYDKDFYGKNNGKIVGEWLNPPAANWISMSPSGERVVVGFSTVRSYARDFTDEIIVGLPAGHGDLSQDAEGNDVFVYFSDIGGGNDWLNVANVATGVNTPLIDWNSLYGGSGCHNSGGHISGIDNVNKPGWAIVGTEGPYQDAVCWPDQSIYMVELKENPRVWRIAHHHAYYTSYGAGAYQTINRAGTKIFFNSTWDANDFNDLDVYQITLPSTWWEDLTGTPDNNPPKAE